MGVSGSGKSTVGRALAVRLDRPFGEGDDFHPAANRAKMAAGHALDDDDRAPWLAALRDWMTSQHAAGRPTVLACSALRHSYRDVLRSAQGGVFFVHLVVAASTIDQRMRVRTHFMPASLLASQLQTLQPLAADEQGATVESAATVDQTVEQIMARPDLPR